MALARYFDKAALSAAGLLRGFDYRAFRAQLEAHCVSVAFDERAASTHEGRYTLELLIELLARLYPSLSLVVLGDDRSLDPAGPVRGLQQRLASRARTVNTAIELVDDVATATVAVVVGDTVYPKTIPTVYAGSSGWIVRVGKRAPMGCGDTPNPFGAGAAACFAAAAVFRTVFAAQLAGIAEVGPSMGVTAAAGANARSSPEQSATESEETLTVSVLDFASASAVLPDRIDIGESFLAGVGAIGNATVWALSRVPGLAGLLHLVDREAVELSNVQRYVLTDEKSIGTSKVELAEHAFTESRREIATSALRIQPHVATWQEVAASSGDYRFDRVLLALDSAADRIAVQGSLPRWIANAWTQPANLGISRHDFLGPGPCVACLYQSAGPQTNQDALVAEALRADGDEALMEIRALLHSGRPVGPAFIKRTAARLGVDPEPLREFAEAPLELFYTRAVCGGILLQLGGGVGPAHATEVPMAFQSALAGLLLALELVADTAQLRPEPLPARTELDLLRPLDRVCLHPHSPAVKHSSGRCICQDAAYRHAFSAKYGSSR
jgi:hypothetical protein